MTKNLRIGNDFALATFDTFLRNLGDGYIPVVQEPDWIELPEDNVFKLDDTNASTMDDSTEEFCRLIFPQFLEEFAKPEEDWIKYVGERAIMAPRHFHVNIINEKMLAWVPGEAVVAEAVDFTLNPEDQLQFPIEFLNTQEPSGLPPAMLKLKVGNNDQKRYLYFMLKGLYIYIRGFIFRLI